MNADAPLKDIAGMLTTLDDRGAIPNEMRNAIQKHADSGLETLPANIAAVSGARATALFGDMGLECGDAAKAAWSISTLSDQMAVMYSLSLQFAPRSTVFATPTPRLIRKGKKRESFTRLALAPNEGST
ncbi:hypothetical protein [Rhodoferax sp. PAMC 29310]|uniref:hypothetical protein n=1 Tax=Rhodoferax sp. PAMC 29310 TaxID=2822760 RepID=UPI001B320C17|nr:hypothetical protein [Rhodoferax sp. PAMC 29310]